MKCRLHSLPASTVFARELCAIKAKQMSRTCLLLVLLLQPIVAYPSWQSKVPNGNVNGKNTVSSAMPHSAYTTIGCTSSAAHLTMRPDKQRSTHHDTTPAVQHISP